MQLAVLKCGAHQLCLMCTKCCIHTHYTSKDTKNPSNFRKISAQNQDQYLGTGGNNLSSSSSIPKERDGYAQK